jgi:hypothetical protein
MALTGPPISTGENRISALKTGAADGTSVYLNFRKHINSFSVPRTRTAGAVVQQDNLAVPSQDL